MIATIPYVEKKFNEFNRLCFNGTLPRIPIELSDAKTFLGMCVYKKRRTILGKTELYDFRLRINTRYDLPEQELEDTIIHEMIHYYIGVNKLEDASAHGPVFRQIMNAINTRYGRHIRISHRNATAEPDKRRRWHVVAVVTFKDGRTGIKVLPRIIQRINYYRQMVSRSPEVDHIDVYATTDIFFNRYPNSTALRVYFVDKSELMQHLADAQKLGPLPQPSPKGEGDI